MKKVILAGVAAVAIIGSSAVYAQHRFDHHHHRLSAEDRAAFVDAKIAAVKAGLKLTPDQEKNWPAVESAVRDFAKQRIDLANARMKEREARRAERRQAGSDSDASREQNRDPVARLRERADRMTETAASLKKIADAADPLYKSLDDSQKRRLAMLARMGGKHGWRRQGFGGFERGMSDDGDQDRAPGHHRGSEGSERL
jgi:hypothetical protein